MNRRFVFSFGFGTLGALIAADALPPAQVEAQGPAAKTPARSRNWTPPRTPWGDPDLQGIWNNATSTPLQRPDAASGKPVLSEEEAAEFGADLAFGLTRDRRDGGADVDVNRAYNEHWMDPKRLEMTADKRTSLIVDPPDGRIPPLVPLTPEREKRRVALEQATRRFNAGLPESYLDAGMPMRCIIRTDRPPYLPIIYNNTFQVYQSPGYVVIHVEMIHSARVIPVDGRPHVGQTLRQWLGDSRGRWDGNTLVVETTNFRPDDGVVYGNADPETFRITERFTRVDANTINYTFTVEDPRTWTRPWTAMIPWNKTEDQLYEYACHEDNFDMVHLLGGARSREKAAAEAAKKN
jgi:hypothetical protein